MGSVVFFGLGFVSRSITAEMDIHTELRRSERDIKIFINGATEQD